jgi:hypothetical protein
MPDAPSAAAGTFADFKIVKTRSVAQFVVEVPLEQADAALAALGGLPQQKSERWVAMALLAPEAKCPQPSKPHRKWKDISPAEQAGIRCADLEFQKWARRHFDPSDMPTDQLVREICGVTSRSELNDNPNAADLWKRMDKVYLEWRAAQGYGDIPPSWGSDT